MLVAKTRNTVAVEPSLTSIAERKRETEEREREEETNLRASHSVVIISGDRFMCALLDAVSHTLH